MNQDTFITLAEKHLHRSLLEPKPIGEYRLHGSLQYLLCSAYGRLEKTIGRNNITEKDVCLLVESWIIAEGTNHDHEDPMVLKSHPYNVPQNYPAYPSNR